MLTLHNRRMKNVRQFVNFLDQKESISHLSEKYFFTQFLFLNGVY